MSKAEPGVDPPSAGKLPPTPERTPRRCARKVHQQAFPAAR
jgi:hypothetical protein